MNTQKSNSRRLMGRKVGKIRQLLGLTQQQLADRMDISKQAYSKLEQSEDIEPERLERIATALGVSVEGLKNFEEDNVFICTQYINDSVTISNSQVGVYQDNFTNGISSNEMIETFEKLIKLQQQQFEDLKAELLRNAKQ